VEAIRIPQAGASILQRSTGKYVRLPDAGMLFMKIIHGLHGRISLQGNTCVTALPAVMMHLQTTLIHPTGSIIHPRSI
jgi:hypothetical protein